MANKLKIKKPKVEKPGRVPKYESGILYSRTSQIYRDVDHEVFVAIQAGASLRLVASFFKSANYKAIYHSWGKAARLAGYPSMRTARFELPEIYGDSTRVGNPRREEKKLVRLFELLCPDLDAAFSEKSLEWREWCFLNKFNWDHCALNIVRVGMSKIPAVDRDDEIKYLISELVKIERYNLVKTDSADQAKWREWTEEEANTILNHTPQLASALQEDFPEVFNISAPVYELPTIRPVLAVAKYSKPPAAKAGGRVKSATATFVSKVFPVSELKGEASPPKEAKKIARNQWYTLVERERLRTFNQAPGTLEEKFAAAQAWRWTAAYRSPFDQFEYKYSPPAFVTATQEYSLLQTRLVQERVKFNTRVGGTADDLDSAEMALAKYQNESLSATKPQFQHSQVSVFWDQIRADQRIHNVVKLLIAEILAVFDNHINTPSVLTRYANGHSGENFEHRKYHILRQIPLFAHTLRVAEYMMQSPTDKKEGRQIRNEQDAAAHEKDLAFRDFCELKDNHHQEMILVALCHDVGKIFGHKQPWNYVSSEHARWSTTVLSHKHYSKQAPVDMNAVVGAIEMHHQPGVTRRKMVTLTDRLARFLSLADRRAREDELIMLQGRR